MMAQPAQPAQPTQPAQPAQVPTLRHPLSIIRLASNAVELRLQILEELQTTIFEFIDEVASFEPDCLAEEPDSFFAYALSHRREKCDQPARNPLHRARPVPIAGFVARVQDHVHANHRGITKQGFAVALAGVVQHAVEVVAQKIEDSERPFRP